MASCDHGMPTPGSCTDCMLEGNLPPAPKQPAEEVEYSFRASRGGQCSGCDLPIVAGVRVSKTTRGRFVHEECAP